jgi:hypothetical protein
MMKKYPSPKYDHDKNWAAINHAIGNKGRNIKFVKSLGE